MKRGGSQLFQAIVLLVVGATGTLLFSTPAWQTIGISREAPLSDLTVEISGRKIDAAPTALALVALAGVIAVIATRGIWRRLVGLVLVLDGVALVWRAIAVHSGLSSSKAWALITEKHPSVSPTNADITSASAQYVWADLTAVCGVFIVVAGVLIAWRGGTWAGMSARYNRAPIVEDEADARARANASLWSSLDRGDDPTAQS